MTIQEKIKEVREGKRFSQYDMADKLGISQSAYLQIEKGKTELTVNRLYQISEVLEVSPFTLMGSKGYISDSRMKTIEESKILIEKLNDQNQKLMDYLMHFIKLTVNGEKDDNLMNEFIKETEKATEFVRKNLESRSE